MGDLTEAQVRALKAFGSSGRESAYSARASLSTMRALGRKNMLRPYDTLGWGFSPSTCQWQITPAGIAALARQGEEK